ncbi:MAG: hypothetical protein ACERKN_20480 [Velocimicrobium sp.]
MRYNLKLLFSPSKWLCCLLFVAMIPVFMYAPTYYDFTNISTIYIPFVGVVLFTDIVMMDKSNNFAEIAYLSNRKPIKTFLQRYCIMAVLLLVLVLLANGIFRISQLINNNFASEPISLLEYVLLACGSSLMLGTLSMSIANVLNNPYVGYGATLFYWLYWNINYKKQSLLNLFPFIANPTFYEKILVAEYLSIAVLVILNCLLTKKSPFFLADQMKKVCRVNLLILK